MLIYLANLTYFARFVTDYKGIKIQTLHLQGQTPKTRTLHQIILWITKSIVSRLLKDILKTDETRKYTFFMDAKGVLKTFPFLNFSKAELIKNRRSMSN